MPEDNAVTELLRELLEDAWNTVVEACDGEETLSHVRQSQPDILLLDIRYATAGRVWGREQIREFPRLASLPVVAVTAYAMQGTGKSLELWL